MKSAFLSRLGEILVKHGPEVVFFVLSTAFTFVVMCATGMLMQIVIRGCK